MNRWLLWTLVGTSALSAWALLAPRGTDKTPIAAAVVHPFSSNATNGIRGTAIPGDSTAIAERWPAPAMDITERSPFVAAVPPATKALPPPPNPAAPPVPPPPPPASYRFWGRMSSPDKHTLMFLAKGQDGAPVEVQQGTRLEDGWTVDSISDNAIVLANPATQQRTTIFAPSAEAGATR